MDSILFLFATAAATVTVQGHLRKIIQFYASNTVRFGSKNMISNISK